jgi:hypothetical protein
MVQTALSCASNDLTTRDGTQPATRSFIAEPQVGSVFAIVVDINLLQVALIDGDDVVRLPSPQKFCTGEPYVVLPLLLS